MAGRAGKLKRRLEFVLSALIVKFREFMGLAEIELLVDRITGLEWLSKEKCSIPSRGNL